MTALQQQGADYARKQRSRSLRMFDTRTTTAAARMTREQRHQAEYERRRAQIAADIQRHKDQVAARQYSRT